MVKESSINNNHKHHLQKSPNNKNHLVTVAVITGKQMVGEFEVFKKIKRMVTLQCISSTSSVYEISADDFIN